MFEDNLAELGYIDKDYILSYVTEEEIFSLVFGFLPEEGDYTQSPLRADNNPGCFFTYFNNSMRFIDFTAKPKHKSVDCFYMVQHFFELPNFYQTLRFIRDKLISGRSLKPLEKKIVKSNSNKSYLTFTKREFNGRDKNFWSKYHITSKNLQDDKVFAVKKVNGISGKGPYEYNLYTVGYAYTDFPDDKVKIYMPFNKVRFLTTCNSDNLGNINNIPISDKSLVITKAYKDCRVLRNYGINSIWVQSENQFPNDGILTDLINRFEHIYVLFDNDSAGIKGSTELSDIINSIYPNSATPLWIPEYLNNSGIKDPSDLITKSKDELTQYLKQNNLI